MSELKTMYELVRFTEAMKSFRIEIPENMIIVSPEIIQEAGDWIAGTESEAIIKTGTGFVICGVNVVRDFAEVVDVTDQE